MIAPPIIMKSNSQSDRIDADRYTANIHSFVLKIWIEEPTEKSGEVVWRGRITHVASGRRQFITRLNDISEFVWPYLKKMGVKRRTCWGMIRWRLRKNRR